MSDTSRTQSAYSLPAPAEHLAAAFEDALNAINGSSNAVDSDVAVESLKRVLKQFHGTLNDETLLRVALCAFIMAEPKVGP